VKYIEPPQDGQFSPAIAMPQKMTKPEMINPMTYFFIAPSPFSANDGDQARVKANP